MAQDLPSHALLAFVGRPVGGRKDHRVRSRIELASAIRDDAIYYQEWNRGRSGGFLGRDRLVGFDRSHFLACVRRHDKRGQSIDSEREGDVGFLAAWSRW